MSSKKGGKNSLVNLAVMNSAAQKALVPPVLQEVGRLAAGVASVNTTGSATGNPRNKCALQPGHSLMDWIRLGASGNDLTGVGSQAGRLSVTPSQLALHNKTTDAWLAIRGRVYNVTAYLPFHPGGPDELMRGAGKDATTLFDQIHPWVNYEQILNKCLIGKLVLIEPTINTEELFFGTKQTPSVVNKDDDDDDDDKKELNPTLPRFDWIQKLDYITIIFYTKAFSNPFVEIQQIGKCGINVNLTYNEYLFSNEIIFDKDILWPCNIKVVGETGKVEITLRKQEGKIWENYGVLKQTSKSNLTNLDHKADWVVKKKIRINYNCFLIEMERLDMNKLIIPLGKHVKIFGELADGNKREIFRSYTPIPSSCFTKLKQQPFTTDTLCLLIKRYPEGNLSKLLSDSQVGDMFHISKPIGDFDLEDIEKRETFLLLSAGTGITPMLSIILFLLERRIRKCRSIRLLFFNKTSKDILLEVLLDDLQKEDPRFTVKHILSQPDDSWQGFKGHITKSFLNENIEEHLKAIGFMKRDLYVMICGPRNFTSLANKFLSELDLKENQTHLFLG